MTQSMRETGNWGKKESYREKSREQRTEQKRNEGIKVRS